MGGGKTAPTSKYVYVGGKYWRYNKDDGTITPVNKDGSSTAETGNQKMKKFAKLTDDEKLSIIKKSSSAEEVAKIPGYINDSPNNTQYLVSSLGLNDKPTVLTRDEFKKYLKDHKIKKWEILARSIDDEENMTAGDMFNMLMYDDNNYIGGKKGGAAFGFGTYFDQNGGKNTGYGDHTIRAVLSPNARVLKYSDVQNLWEKFQIENPKTANHILFYNGVPTHGNALSLFALVTGYNVIEVSNGYHVALTRDALVIEEYDGN